ncbi:hypothetical protein [Marinobacter sp. HL-58]|uniref:hypothetical protein n=1 Tax=Marinobacter sp. HL-58 TaxID=1479237 RepID=UPI000484D1D1|nr:hypothetical protein [Marinobacter sp. HL-58]KPQ01678.1 MAG: hypothetical protein HLUCCO03_11615 [Marinobacter sp. HL-58]
MILEAETPDGEPLVSDNPAFTAEDAQDINRTTNSESKIRSTIDNLNISADAKSALYSITNATVRAGRFIIKIGRKILDIVIETLNSFPNASFGLVLGGILGVLVASVPFIGAILAPFLTPLAMIYGFVVGMKQDVNDKNLSNAIAAANAQFEHFKE